MNDLLTFSLKNHLNSLFTPKVIDFLIYFQVYTEEVVKFITVIKYITGIFVKTPLIITSFDSRGLNPLEYRI